MLYIYLALPIENLIKSGALWLLKLSVADCCCITLLRLLSSQPRNLAGPSLFVWQARQSNTQPFSSLWVQVFLEFPKNVLRDKEMRASFNYFFKCGCDFKLLTMHSFISDLCNRKSGSFVVGEQVERGDIFIVREQKQRCGTQEGLRRGRCPTVAGTEVLPPLKLSKGLQVQLR